MASLLRSWRHTKYFGRASSRAIHNCRKRQPPAAVATVTPKNEPFHRTTRSCTTRPIENPELFAKDSAQDDLNRQLDLLDVSIRERQEAAAKNVRSIIEHLQREEATVQPFHALLLIRATGRFLRKCQPPERRLLCTKLWELLATKGVSLDVSHYNALLRTYTENEEYGFDPIAFVADAKNAGIAPNKVTYQHLINCCCKKGDIASATRLLELMKDEGLPLTTGIFSSLVTGYSEAGDIEKAAQIPSLMKEAGVEMTGEVYAALIGAHAKVGNAEAVTETLETCDRRGITFTSCDIMKTIHQLLRNKQPEAAEKLLPYLPKNAICGAEETQVLLSIIDAAGKTDLATAILDSFARMSVNNIGNFYEGLFMSNLPKDDILKILQYMKRWLKDPYRLAVLKMTQLEDGRFTIELLRQWRNFGAEIRQQYFFPVMSNYGRKHDVQGILETTEAMVKEFDTLPCVYAVTDYIIPYGLSMHVNPAEIAEALKKLEIPEIVANNAVAAYLLGNGKLRAAAKYVTENDGPYSDELIQWRLVTRLAGTGDTTSFNKIFAKLWSQMPNCPQEETRIIDGVIISKVSADHYLTNLMTPWSKCSPVTVRKVAEYMNSIGCVPSQSVADALSAYIQEAGLPPIGAPTDEQKQQQRWPPDVPREPLDDSAARTSSEQLLNDHISQNKPESAETALQLLRTLLTARHPFRMRTINRCVEFLCNLGLTGEATNFVEAVRCDSGRFLPSYVIFRVARELAAKSRPEEVANFLARNGDKIQSRWSSEHACEFLRDAAPTSEPDDLYTHYQSLVTGGYLEGRWRIRACEILLAHALERKCTANALTVFDELAREHQALPGREQLAQLVIEKGNVDELQHFTDSVAAVTGEREALASLVFDLLKGGRKNEAAKVARVSGLLQNTRRLSRMLQRFAEDGDAAVVEGFLDIAEGTAPAAAETAYEILLQIYVTKNDWQSGLALWTRMQEVDAIPSARLLSTLASLLKANLQEIPFSVTSTAKPDTETSPPEALESAENRDKR